MLETISHSKLDTYKRCPRWFQYEYIDKMLGLSSDALDIGTFVHKGIELYHREKDWLPHIRKKILINMDKKTVDKFEMVRICIEKYIENPLDGDTIGLEKKFVMPFINSKGEKLPIKLKGIIDRMTKTGLIDYKTTSSDYTQEQVDESWQATIYAYFFLKQQGRLPEEIIYWIINKNKIKQKNYKPQILYTYRTQEDIDNLFEEIKKILEKINIDEKDYLENDLEFDVNPGDHCFWCSFRKECPRI